MISIALLYSRDTSDIADQLRSSIKETQKDWKTTLCPIISESDSMLWSAIRTGSLKADVVVFLASEQFLRDNKAHLSSLVKSNNVRYRFAGIVIGRSLRFPEMQITLDVEFPMDYTSNNSLVSDKLIDDFLGYCKIVDLANKNTANIKKEKHERSRKQTTLIFGSVLAYLSVIVCAMALLFSDGSTWSRHSAEMTLIFLCVFSLFIICALTYFVFTGIQKRREHAEQTEFGKDLDMSLSKNAQKGAVPSRSNPALELVSSVVPLLSYDLLDPVFSLLTHSKPEKEDIPYSGDLVDVEMSRAIGEDTYLPLGHLKLNWKQMKGYYDISKKQAKTAFNFAITICFIGIAIFIFAVLSPLIPIFASTDALVPIIGTIGGTIVELFAGTILVVYKKTLAQMNLYHQALADYQRYLSCINLVNLISDEEKRNQLYEQIISVEMNKTPHTQDDSSS